MLEWEWYNDPLTKSVFLDLILTSNHEETKYRGTLIKRGETITGYPYLAKRLGISVQNARTAIKKLKSTGELTVKVTGNGSLITLTNYEKFQLTDSKINRRTNSQSNRQLTGNQQATNNSQEYKNNKNEKKLKKEYIGDKSPITPKEENKKIKYMEYVYLTEDEFEKLKLSLGEGVDEYIERLNGYIGQIGEVKARNKYKSHYHTILNWWRKDGKPQKEIMVKKNSLDNPKMQAFINSLNQKND